MGYYVANFDVDDYDMTDTQRDARQLYSRSIEYSGVFDFIDTIRNKPETPIKTGLQALDDIMNGGLYSGLYMLGGATGVGKTTLLIQTARKIVEQNNGVDVLYFGLETSQKEFFGKMLSGYLFDCCGVGLSYNELIQTPRDGAALAEIEKCAKDLGDKIKGRVLVYPERQQGYTTDEITEIVKLHHDNTGHRFVVMVDYLQRLQQYHDTTAPTRREQVDNDIYSLSSIAKAYDVPCVAVSSLNRSSYTRNSGRLQNTGFKESGGIEYTCDLSLFLEEQRTKVGKSVVTRRDETASWNSVQDTATTFERVTVNKNRHGATGTALLKYAKAYNTFDNDDTGTAEYNPYFDDYITTTVRTTTKKHEEPTCDNWNIIDKGV